jgi:hypothetical protein
MASSQRIHALRRCSAVCIEELLNERPGEASIAADLDLAPIRRAVTALLPSEEVGTP